MEIIKNMDQEFILILIGFFIVIVIFIVLQLRRKNAIKKFDLDVQYALRKAERAEKEEKRREKPKN